MRRATGCKGRTIISAAAWIRHAKTSLVRTGLLGLNGCKRSSRRSEATPPDSRQPTLPAEMMVSAQADARGLAVRNGPKTKLTPNRIPEISAGRHQSLGASRAVRMKAPTSERVKAPHFAPIAQSVEQPPCMRHVAGSIPCWGLHDP